jgi:amidophosphoribosyltransferase
VSPLAGLLALFSFEPGWSLHSFIRYGLLALQHRGGGRRVVCSKVGGEVTCRDLGDWSSRDLNTRVAIAATYSSDRLDGLVVCDGVVAAVTDRRSRYLEEVVGELSRAVSRGATWGAVVDVLDGFTGVDLPTFLATTNRGELIAWRTPSGLTPLVVGGYGFDMLLASSESSAIEVLDADVRRYLGPAEGVYASGNYLKFFKTGGGVGGALCAFELLYTARHDAVVDGVPVYEFRKSLGRELSKLLTSDVDVVVGVPETATPYAIGLAQAVGRPFELAFVPTAARGRSMMKVDPMERLIAVHLKLNPIRSSLEGRRVAVVDDSMVTGTTMRSVSQVLRLRVGVREVHLLVASPKLVRSCPYAVFELSEDHLIAANLSDELARAYLEVDTLAWLDLGSVEGASKAFRCRLCRYCFGGEGPGGAG